MATAIPAVAISIKNRSLLFILTLRSLITIYNLLWPSNSPGTFEERLLPTLSSLQSADEESVLLALNQLLQWSRRGTLINIFEGALDLTLSLNCMLDSSGFSEGQATSVLDALQVDQLRPLLSSGSISVRLKGLQLVKRLALCAASSP